VACAPDATSSCTQKRTADGVMSSEQTCEWRRECGATASSQWYHCGLELCVIGVLCVVLARVLCRCRCCGGGVRSSCVALRCCVDVCATDCAHSVVGRL
jgi:hypothetical protein